ncbi:MAG TPA: DNA repair protein RadA [Gammaproteobacteria bacterium]|nr:DNA repair protein RadA [Gammaproteobacteria bacterium]
MRAKTQYQCQECGAISPKWAGQCSDCGAWNTFVETMVEARPSKSNPRFAGVSGEAATIHNLNEVAAGDEPRLPTNIAELDRVLGGGVVAGSVVLIGGDPGIGKSTLLLQMLAAVGSELPTLYVSGEESSRQIAMRARRLGIDAKSIRLLTETNIERALELAKRESPRLMVVDSIQTMYTELLTSAPGSVSQVRESAAQLVRYAKTSGVSMYLVGHVTKEGALAGPRVLEHMVDTVLYFEGDGGSRYRVVRAVKNRYGAVNELGVFAMTDKGLREVTNPSAIFLSRHEKDVPGSVVMVTREGTRPLLVEVQALVDESKLSNPRRVTVGLDGNRLAMLLAIAHRHAGIVTYDQDVFVNVVGGVRVSETGADLAVLLAVLSSLRGKPLPQELVVFGEVGLAGEIRPVPGGPERLREAAKHGYTQAIVPKANAPKEKIEGVKIQAVTTLTEALAQW